MNFRLSMSLSFAAALIMASLAASSTVFAQDAIHLTVNQVDSASFPTITTYMTVTGANGLPIEGLGRDLFSLAEDGRPVANVSVSELQAGGEPISVILAIDTSGSMLASAVDSSGQATTALANTQQAASDFVGSLEAGDRAGLATFSDEAVQAVPLTNDLQLVTEAIGGLTAAGETALFDAIVTSVDMLKTLPAGRKAIILLADGRNNSSTFSFDEAIDEASRWSIPVYPIGFGNVNQATMEKIASLTGGYAQIKPDSTELQEAFATVLRVLRHQYVLQFDSSFPADGQQHVLSVTLNYHGAQVQGSHSFLATPSQILVGLSGLGDGDTVGGNVKFLPEIIAPARISEVTFTLDGTSLGTVLSEPFEYLWDSTGVAAGEHTLLVLAKDTAGNSGSIELSVVVRPPISVEWTNPTHGAEITRPQILTAEIDSMSGLARVEFYVDGKPLGTVTEPPYELEWTLDGVEPGDHLLRVVAIDVNNRAVDQEIRVAVSLQSSSLILVVAVIILVGGAIVVVPLASRRRRKMARRGAQAQAIAPAGQSAAPAVLQELEGLQPGQAWPIAAEEIRIGRHKAENDIPAAGRSASRRHAVIKQEEGNYVLHDLNPENPTHVNGEAVRGQHTLSPGDTIQIGESLFRFEVNERG